MAPEPEIALTLGTENEMASQRYHSICAEFRHFNNHLLVR